MFFNISSPVCLQLPWRRRVRLCGRYWLDNWTQLHSLRAPRQWGNHCLVWEHSHLSWPRYGGQLHVLSLSALMMLYLYKLSQNHRVSLKHTCLLSWALHACVSVCEEILQFEYLNHFNVNVFSRPQADTGTWLRGLRSTSSTGPPQQYACCSSTETSGWTNTTVPPSKLSALVCETRGFFATWFSSVRLVS